MAIMETNMGKTDRIIRGALGGLMLLDGLAHARESGLRTVESTVGGAFLAYSLTGFDPLLKLFGTSTIPGAENNLLSKIKQAAPGQGVNPILTQQATSRQKARRKTIAESTAIE